MFLDTNDTPDDTPDRSGVNTSRTGQTLNPCTLCGGDRRRPPERALYQGNKIVVCRDCKKTIAGETPDVDRSKHRLKVTEDCPLDVDPGIYE